MNASLVVDNTDRTHVAAIAGDQRPACADESDYQHAPQMYVGVPCSELVYVGFNDRASFDRITLPCETIESEHGTVLVKSLEQPDGIRVVFQYWQKSLTAKAFIRRRREQRASEAERVSPRGK